MTKLPDIKKLLFVAEPIPESAGEHSMKIWSGDLLLLDGVNKTRYTPRMAYESFVETLRETFPDVEVTFVDRTVQ